MLVLTRAPGEKLYIGRGIVLVVLGRRGNEVRLGIEAPQSERVSRHEFGWESHLRAQLEREGGNGNSGAGRPDHGGTVGNVAEG